MRDPAVGFEHPPDRLRQKRTKNFERGIQEQADRLARQQESLVASARCDQGVEFRVEIGAATDVVEADARAGEVGLERGPNFVAAVDSAQGRASGLEHKGYFPKLFERYLTHDKGACGLRRKVVGAGHRDCQPLAPFPADEPLILELPNSLPHS